VIVSEKRSIDILGWILLVGTVALIFVLLAAAQASARPDVSTGQAHKDYKSALREFNAAKARLSEARYVEDKTESITSIYGGSVGRWVWLARHVGWDKDDIDKLMYVINRESRGDGGVTNSSSGAAGLLQFMPQWYTGQWSLPAFDPYNPEENLRMGLRLYKMQGWTPWAI
jgi:soluble lytic murein transglycosylase-like protein